MSTRDTPWPAGTPCWVDVTVKHLERARSFYSHMFGWDTDAGSSESGGYITCLKNGRPVAGLVSAEADTEEQPAWLTYFATEDIDATTSAVRQAGGTVLLEPQVVRTMGSMAVYSDPAGATFAAWQAGDHTGFQLFNESGTVVWTDLMTRDLRAALDFYAAVFGFTYEESGEDYRMIKTVSGRIGGGIHQTAQLPDDAPPSWLVHFAVADRDSSMSMAEMEDAKILMTIDTPFGPEAVLEGPAGEVFNIIALTEEPQDQD